MVRIPLVAMGHGQAIRRGFPLQPRKYERVIDPRGVVWQWFPDERIKAQTGLHDLGELGFWGALVSAVAGPLIGGLFGGGGTAKKQQAQLDQLTQTVDNHETRINTLEDMPTITKQVIILGSIILLGFIAIRK